MIASKNVFNRAQTELLEELAKNYANILIIIDPTGNLRTEVYVASEFRTVEKDTYYCSIRGFKQITDIIDQNSTYVNSVDSVLTVTTAIDHLTQAVSSKERKFSDRFIWIKL